MNPRKPFIVFVILDPKPGRSTRTWEVRNHLTNATVGLVEWYGAFRKYSFFPKCRMVFDSNCLDLLSSFMTQATKEHMDALARRKNASRLQNRSALGL
jgi:hypothetical protein